MTVDLGESQLYTDAEKGWLRAYQFVRSVHPNLSEDIIRGATDKIAKEMAKIKMPVKRC